MHDLSTNLPYFSHALHDLEDAVFFDYLSFHGSDGAIMAKVRPL